MKYEDNISSLLVRFEDGDEIAYHINWLTGLAEMFVAVGIEYLEEMSVAL